MVIKKQKKLFEEEDNYWPTDIQKSKLKTAGNKKPKTRRRYFPGLKK